MTLRAAPVSLLAAVTAVASVTLTQEDSNLPRVAYLWPASPGIVQAEYNEGLRALGHVEGKTILVDGALFEMRERTIARGRRS